MRHRGRQGRAQAVLEAGVRGMSASIDAATATLMAAKIGVVGGVGGVVIGVALERLLRYLGGVWCESAHHAVNPLFGDSYEGFQTATEPDDAEWIDYEIRVDLYNGREVPVGLRDVRVVFRTSDGYLSKVPNDKAELLRRPQSGGRPEPQMYSPPLRGEPPAASVGGQGDHRALISLRRSGGDPPSLRVAADRVHRRSPAGVAAQAEEA